MVNLTRIYTRTGDAGETRLGDMSDDDARPTCGCRPTPTSTRPTPTSGVALATGGLDDDVVAVLTTVQNDLFDVGADFCTPVVADPEYPPLRIEQDYVDRLEAWCDQYNEDLPKLRSFILNGGTPGGRAPARRPHRRPPGGAVRPGRPTSEHADTMNVLAIKYLNRLSDLLFILARHANRASRRRAVGARRRALSLPAGDLSGSAGVPGGAASSQARKPVSASGLIATSSSPDGVRQVTTMWPEYSEYASTPSASRRPTYSSSERR